MTRRSGLSARSRARVLGLALEGKTRSDDWTEHTRAFVERSVPEDASDERIERLVAELRAHTDALFIPEAEVAQRTRRGHRRLLEHIDDAVIEAYLDDRADDE